MTRPGCVVRVLDPADALAFRTIRLEALRLHPGAYGSTLADWATLSEAQFVDRIEGSVIFGLWTAAGLEGLLAYDRESGGNARHRAALHAVYLREHLRGTGALDLLMQAAIDRARGDRLAQLELTVAVDNVAAIAAYHRHGFGRVAVLPRALCVAGAYVDEALMVLELDT